MEFASGGHNFNDWKEIENDEEWCDRNEVAETCPECDLFGADQNFNVHNHDQRAEHKISV